MSLVDFHCHLSAAGGYRAIPAETSLFGGPTKVLAVTNRAAEWQQMKKSGERPDVSWALGLHPAGTHDEAAVAAVLRHANHADAIGEVGLDYSSRSMTPRAEQRRTLDRLLGHDEVRRRLVSIHSVGATEDVVAAIAENPVPGAVLHWFLGDGRRIEAAIDIDVFFSINEAMLGSGRGRRVIASLPPNRVLLETDAPYGGAGSRPNVPGDLRRLIEGLAGIWDKDESAVESLVLRNQHSLRRRLDVVPQILRL